jgi:hypothetical protein
VLYEDLIVEAEQHRMDLLHEAEQMRRIHSLQDGLPPHPSIVGAGLAHLGGWLIAVGSRLQANYGALVEPPIAVQPHRKWSR